MGTKFWWQPAKQWILVPTRPETRARTQYNIQRKIFAHNTIYIIQCNIFAHTTVKSIKYLHTIKYATYNKSTPYDIHVRKCVMYPVQYTRADNPCTVTEDYTKVLKPN